MLRPAYKSLVKASLLQKRLISSKGSKLYKPSPDSASTILLSEDPLVAASSSSSSATSGIINSNDFPLFNKNSQNTTNTTSSQWNNTSDLEFDPFNKSHASAITTMTRTRDVMQLWSLLEACLQSHLMKRAFSILESLYMVPEHKHRFIEDYNMYLNAFSKNEPTFPILKMNEKLTNDLETNFKDINYNDKTLAIMIHHALNFHSTTSSMLLIPTISAYLKMSVNSVREILSNLDILTVSDLNILVNDLKIISPSQLPNSVKPILESLALSSTPVNNIPNEDGSKKLEVKDGSSEERKVDVNHGSMKTASLDPLREVSLNGSTEVLPKDAEKLIAVDTIGMRVIRHTLLGLSLTAEQKEQISKFKFDANENILNMKPTQDDNSDTSINFFEIYNSLPTLKEKKAFESALNIFNQDRQKVLENRATEAARERWKHDFEEAKARGDISIEKNLNAKLWRWYNDMLPLVKEEIKHCKSSLSEKPTDKKGLTKVEINRLGYGPYLTLIDPGKMCVITILELLKLNSTGGVIEGMRTARAVISVGKAIEMEFRSEQVLKSESQTFRDVNKKSPEFKKLVQNAKSVFRSSQIEQSKILWPQNIRAQIGSVLISMLIHVAKVSVQGVDPITKAKVHGEAPAFAHGYQYHNGSKLGVLKIHKTLIHQLNGERLIASVQPQLLPMLVEPKSWINWRSGGYHYTQSTLLRTKDSPEQVAYLKAASENGDIDRVYDGLNVLGNTPWTVNRKVFDVVSQVWNKREGFLDIPGAQDEMVLPPAPPRNSDPSILRTWKLEVKTIANKFSSDRSNRCDTNYKLEIARAFLGEKLYFPHNLDFRGRAYPLSPHFNHLGNDMSRGLLIFWHGKKLGPSGLKWLKIHLSNLFGFDKLRLEDRVSFTESHLEDIKDSAENPLTGQGWWKTADKPWQALATCFELNEVMKMDNPEDFISHQPIHQDGTCNGLQHYAALGGDVEGATQVNLVPSDKPQDVYAHVARLVQKRLEIAAEKGDENAKILQDKITRKVVKQTVMTNVYGVTYVGATFQIAKQLSPIFDDRKESLDFSKYLTKHVFGAIRELFHSAHLIQDWLGESAKRISKSIRLDVDEKSFKNGNKPDFMSSVIWTTPLGLPIVQPYREESKKQVETNLQTVFISDPFAVNPVNARRQKAGLPPNFIHSLDASHMLLSAAECGEKGLDFASVHDSYWTHASDVDTMSVVLREQFIKLHEVDLVLRLKEEFGQRYKNYVKIGKLKRSTDLAQNIIKIRKDLSKKLGRNTTLADEIYFEKKRQELLNSPLVEDRNVGEKMVTTVSLFQDIKDLDALELENGGDEKSGMSVLLPLRLPEIPPKGDFDVTVLRGSQYFFS
ncbi:rpo41p [Saccharomyces arboricola H-6]|uniref:DNA-directed RNA polymerase n=1 Tax=Saccharomyces arboricola (strain H-6 / AS 2.3317 / CBS 10644) TaxID=1160507 RepID=J8PP58_SACAR|nr:rpo41p [Saccharomyces arboricola H-6]